MLLIQILVCVYAAAAMQRCETLKSELPDCVISYIFSMLSMKDLVKISTLSKRWQHEWESRIDLNFDLQNMFDNHNNTIGKGLQSQFATRLDQFMLHYQGSIIRSIRINFPLGDQHSDVIDRLISRSACQSY